jgi:hypothetical protein
MASIQRSGRDGGLRHGARHSDPEVSAVPITPRVMTPDDVVPRLVALGVPLAPAGEVAGAYPEQRITDALDALEELDARRRVLDPVGWVDAAIKQRWDLSGLLAQRREREQRLDILDRDRQHRNEAFDAYPRWRDVADRWDAAISAALDDEQLARALRALTGPVDGLGRGSVPVSRAELIAWAVEVHVRNPGTPLVESLAEDLEHGPSPAPPHPWPLPEPPETTADQQDVASLSSRIGATLGAEPDTATYLEPARHVAVPHRTVRFGEDLER